MLSAAERRNEDRIAFRVPAHVMVGDQRQLVRGYVINLSEGGAFVMLDDQAALPPSITLEFTLRGRQPCRARARLAHVVPLGKGQGFGLEITERNDGYRAFIASLATASQVELMALISDMSRIVIEA
jgi:hypothetical protein